MDNLLQIVIITEHKNIITERKIYIMKNLAYVTLLIESNNEDDFESKSNDIFDDHFNGDSSQHKKVKLTEKAYQKHISELKKYDF